MNDLRTGFLERHCKRLHEAIDIVSPPAKRACLEKAQEDLGGAPLSTMPQSNEASPSAATAVQPEAATPSNASTAEEVRETEAGPDAVITERTPNEKSSPAPAASPSWEELMEMLKGVARFTDAEAPSTKMFDFFPLIKRVSGGAPLSTMPQSDEASPSAAITERAPNEKGSPTLAVSPSWEELMEMLKGVSCFMDAEAPSMKMFDFFPLIKRVSVNMGGDPPNFVSAWLPFCTLESAVSCIQHLQEWTMLETVEVVILFIFPSSSSFLATHIPSPGTIFGCCCLF